MEVYETAIISAVASFPLLALLITLPYFIYNYHKYGSISKIRIFIVYGFVLYMMCAYFLVIMPLPTFEAVAKLTTPSMQLIPGQFLIDFFKESGFVWNDIHTYIKALCDRSFYQPFFNLFLTVPFGMYLRYYHKCGWFKTFILSFLLSLFFELTQLSGIYFIYPRSYRLFDVDDLLFNTLGGLLGFFIGGFFMKFLPSRDDIDKMAIQRSTKVSGLRRIVTFIIDIFICSCIGFTSLLILIFYDQEITFKIFAILYLVISGIIFLLMPLIFKRSIGGIVTNLKIDGKWYQRLFRIVLKYFYLFLLPFILMYMIYVDSNYLYALLVYIILVIIDNFIILFNGRLWYEKITRTKMISTIVVKDE